MSKMTFWHFDGPFALEVEDGEAVTRFSTSGEVIFWGGVRTPLLDPLRGGGTPPKMAFLGVPGPYISVLQSGEKLQKWHFGILTDLSR